MALQAFRLVNPNGECTPNKKRHCHRHQTIFSCMCVHVCTWCIHVHWMKRKNTGDHVHTSVDQQGPTMSCICTKMHTNVFGWLCILSESLSAYTKYLTVSRLPLVKAPSSRSKMICQHKLHQHSCFANGQRPSLHIWAILTPGSLCWTRIPFWKVGVESQTNLEPGACVTMPL